MGRPKVEEHKFKSLSRIDPAIYRRAMYHFYHSEASKTHPGQRPSDGDLSTFADWRETHMVPNYSFDNYVRDLDNYPGGAHLKVKYVTPHSGGRKKKE